MFKHTLEELKQWQSLPLDVKIMMSCDRIRDWVGEYGEDGTCISFSGGKDSTVLLDLIRNRCGFKNVPAIFVDVPTQFPESREFVQKFENVIIIKPKINFMQVCETYGFPLISKEVSREVYFTRQWEERKARGENPKMTRSVQKVRGLDIFENSMYSCKKWEFLVDADFQISNKCCVVMKKSPIHMYERKTGRHPFIGQMAEESLSRESSWIKYGCNIYDSDVPRNNPMAFWTEQDVLKYIHDNKLPICSVYGDVITKEKQMTFDDVVSGEPQLEYKTTGVTRTGCMLCGFGCHLEKSPNRFELLKETHPKMYAMLDVVKNNGITMRQAIEWINEHGGTDIKL